MAQEHPGTCDGAGCTMFQKCWVAFKRSNDAGDPTVKYVDLNNSELS